MNILKYFDLASVFEATESKKSSIDPSSLKNLEDIVSQLFQKKIQLLNINAKNPFELFGITENNNFSIKIFPLPYLKLQTCIQKSHLLKNFENFIKKNEFFYDCIDST